MLASMAKILRKMKKTMTENEKKKTRDEYGNSMARECREESSWQIKIMIIDRWSIIINKIHIKYHRC